ncbi:hypothetical protein NDU88_004588 [Pleurodeles waltl]|uniref:Uncharacterized protein n=1 Tax=Pleurodeles waltl TaxID=8319 RepID=A0AAV7W5E2_PLEWA|nr:hypothetical protein NDU88_004588 [Pleurodeles waltl]
MEQSIRVEPAPRGVKTKITWLYKEEVVAQGGGSCDIAPPGPELISASVSGHMSRCSDSTTSILGISPAGGLSDQAPQSGGRSTELTRPCAARRLELVATGIEHRRSLRRAGGTSGDPKEQSGSTDPREGAGVGRRA